MSFKNSLAVGWDVVPFKLIKASVDLTYLILAQIINQCLITGTFPEKLKFAQIRPIY